MDDPTPPHAPSPDGEAHDEEVAPSWPPSRPRGPAGGRRPRRAASPLALLGPVVVQAGAVATQSPLVRADPRRKGEAAPHLKVKSQPGTRDLGCRHGRPPFPYARVASPSPPPRLANLGDAGRRRRRPPPSPATVGGAAGQLLGQRLGAFVIDVILTGLIALPALIGPGGRPSPWSPAGRERHHHRASTSELARPCHQRPHLDPLRRIDPRRPMGLALYSPARGGSEGQTVGKLPVIGIRW